MAECMHYALFPFHLWLRQSSVGESGGIELQQCVGMQIGRGALGLRIQLQNQLVDKDSSPGDPVRASGPGTCVRLVLGDLGHQSTRCCCQHGARWFRHTAGIVPQMSPNQQGISEKLPNVRA